MITLLNSYVEVEVAHTSQASQPSVLGVPRIKEDRGTENQHDKNSEDKKRVFKITC